MVPSDMVNIAFDLHLYQVFGAFWQSMSLSSLLEQTRSQREYDVQTIKRRFGAVTVGEWTVDMPWRSPIVPFPQTRDLNRLSVDVEEKQKEFYGCTHVHALAEATAGTFYWTWNTAEHNGDWNVQRNRQRAFRFILERQRLC